MKKVLLIEDEQDQITMIEARMESCGYQFVAAHDGEEGIKKAYEEMPDIILLDIVMPKVNGYEVCAHLKSDLKTSKIPIIVITASGVKRLEEKCIALGVEEIIRKPYDSRYLEERIAYHLRD